MNWGVAEEKNYIYDININRYKVGSTGRRGAACEVVGPCHFASNFCTPKRFRVWSVVNYLYTNVYMTIYYTHTHRHTHSTHVTINTSVWQRLLLAFCVFQSCSGKNCLHIVLRWHCDFLSASTIVKRVPDSIRQMKQS